MADASVLEQGAVAASETFDELFHKELYRCANNAYNYIATDIYPSVIECNSEVVNNVIMNTTGVLENMFREHSRNTCSCHYHVFVGRGPNCWMDGDWYSCYYDYLLQHGNSSYYTKIEESVVSEVVELSSDCYRFSRHPITFEPRDCSADGGYCVCNLKITHLTATCLINDLYVLRYPAMRTQCHILSGGENVIRDTVSGQILEHFNDRSISQWYRAQL